MHSGTNSKSAWACTCCVIQSRLGNGGTSRSGHAIRIWTRLESGLMSGCLAVPHGRGGGAVAVETQKRARMDRMLVTHVQEPHEKEEPRKHNCRKNVCPLSTPTACSSPWPSQVPYAAGMRAEPGRVQQVALETTIRLNSVTREDPESLTRPLTGLRMQKRVTAASAAAGRASRNCHNARRGKIHPVLDPSGLAHHPRGVHAGQAPREKAVWQAARNGRHKVCRPSPAYVASARHLPTEA